MSRDTHNLLDLHTLDNLTFDTNQKRSLNNDSPRYVHTYYIHAYILTPQHYHKLWRA